ncbi:hypothetical protein BN8_00362 [Fibrisoma limi BUZ 3]|uniref:Tryptophan-rich sensory protein n=1 Tax=Fibrisoma limi BUZ 3 TaxID=1185876 RepID=I2GC14_9BACT|nr:hypothetical protein BN8_00362 [Fibrisoma limi BUZ 3]
MNELRKAISSVTNQLYLNAWLKTLLLGVTLRILTQTVGLEGRVMAALSTGVGMVIGLWATRPFSNKKPRAISIIHRSVGDAEYSLPLLDKAELNLAEQLQLERLNERIQRVSVPTVIFSRLGVYGLLLAAAVAIHLAYPLLQSDLTPSPTKSVNRTVMPNAEEQTIPAFESATLRVQPPAYTRLPERRSADLNVTAISGSQLTWQVQLSSSQDVTVRLSNSRGEERPFKKAGEQFAYSDRLVNSGLYTIKAYWNDSLIYQSDLYRLEAQPDLAPKIEPASKELYRYHYLKDPKTINVSAKISDDFLVSQAFIVATVARGSGENVKFREVKLPLGQANFKESRITKSIDLKALNFAPGDELYYYWAAFDNRQPEPNFAKSDTYFIVYKDTTKMDEAELATMAVNVMPEYFRSQRQIIIDTEKLIAKRSKIPAKPFNSTSNEIGFDQKVLRLRYGQYLGEEFETSIGGHGGPEGGGDGDPLEGFMHKHDSGEGEHEHDHDHDDKHEAHEESHDHGHSHGGNQNPAEEKDPIAAMMEQYVHSHDDGEANTYYEQSTRSLLKMALEQMWQSELHLRLYEPEKALPYEKKALEFLKAAQQKARTFVKKTSFDPPPIKEQEKRLTGELKNVNPRFSQQRTYDQQRVGQLAAEVLGYLDQSNELNAAQRQAVQQLGTALTDRVMNSGLRNWSVLSSLQKLVGGQSLSESEENQLKTKLAELTGVTIRTNRSYSSERKLEQAFWKRLK